MNKTIFNMPTGPIEVCTVFDFIPKVKRNFLPSHYHEIALDLKQSYQYAGPFQAQAEARVQSKHKLVTNPMKLLTELKRTMTPIFIHKEIELEDLLYKVSTRSAMEMGYPTHFFSIGEDVYALVSEEDCVLFQTDTFRQQLICHHPMRNFIVHAPNLKVRFK